MVFYRRSGDIIEIQEGLPTDIEAEACSPGYMNQDQLPFTSLLSKYEHFYLRLQDAGLGAVGSLLLLLLLSSLKVEKEGQNNLTNS